MQDMPPRKRRVITLADGTKLLTAAQYADEATKPDWDGKCCGTVKGGKRKGEKCRNKVEPGTIVCKLHTRVARIEESARRRRVQDLFDEYRELHGDDVDPLAVLLEAISTDCRMVAVYERLVGTLAEESSATFSYEWMGGDDDGKGGRLVGVVINDEPALVDPDHLGDLKSHPFVTELKAWNDSKAKHAKLALDAGVEERQVRIAEQQAEQLSRAVVAAFDALDLFAEQQSKASQVIANLLRAITGS